ncbi:MAG TPA: hypothetical protein DCG73_05805 [Morganella sp. (in: Bacteria)]|nr:hypothetical protein [Morganella sp. (in: enterobacteria)]
MSCSFLRHNPASIPVYLYEAAVFFIPVLLHASCVCINPVVLLPAGESRRQDVKTGIDQEK